MLCPYCAKENVQTSGYCSFCRQPLTPGYGSVGQSPSSLPGPFPQPPAKTGARRAVVIVIAMVSVLMGAGATGWILSTRETPEQHIDRLLREAAGLQPVRQAFFPGERKFDDAVREQYSGLLQQNREYTAAVRKVDATELARINTPESFADPDSATEARKLLHVSYDLDATQEQKLTERVANIRHVLEESAWSASDREAYLAGFDNSMAQVTPKRQRLLATEKVWIDSVDELYNYASEHRGSIKVSGGRVAIADGGVLQQFNTLIETEEARRNDLLQARQEFNQYQGDTMQKLGVTQKDLGVE